jgi:hypothetical protein
MNKKLIALHNSGSRLPTLRVIRILGVPLAIIFLWPGANLAHHISNHQVAALLFSVSLFTCIPFSRLRGAALFWPVFLLFAALAIAVSMVFGWTFVTTFSAVDFREDTGLLIYSLAVLAGFLLLLAQLPCILILRGHRETQSNQSRGCV